MSGTQGHYNFDEIVDRSENFSAKYEEPVLHYGTNNVIPLWVADMDFRTAPKIVEAIKARADQGIFGYTYRPQEYWEAVRNWNLRRNHHAFDTALMSFTPGVVPGMRMLLEQFSQPGDAVIVTQPVYHPFIEIVETTGRTLVNSPLKRSADGRYEMDFADFEEKVRSRNVRWFLLCNPHNPVGRSWSREELQRVGEICLKYGVEILSDEIHSDLMIDGHRHTVMASVSPGIAAITTTLVAPSKTFNLAGLQAATIIFPTGAEEKKAAYDRRLEVLDIRRNNCFSLVATMTAYNECGDWVDELCAYLTGNLRFIQDFCAKEIPELRPVMPEATYLCWIDCSGLGFETSQDIIRFCVEKAGIAPGIGADFGQGGDQYIRINAACPRAVLEKAFTQLRDAVRELRS